MAKRVYARQIRSRDEGTVSKAEERKAIIDRLFAHCRYCGFFFERAFEGDDVCDSPRCSRIEQEEKEIN